MQIGNVFVKIVERKLQTSGKGTQFMLLAGYNPKVTHATATYVETLSPTHVITEDEVIEAIEKARVKNSAVGVTNVTHPGVTKKLEKMFETVKYPDLHAALHGKTFAQMGIGHYL